MNTPSFIITREAWYAPYSRVYGAAAEIMIGDYSEDGCGGEFAIRWHELGSKAVPRLEMFDDAWGFLAAPACAPLWAWLAEHEGHNAEDAHVAAFLRSLGWADITQRVNPNAPKTCPTCGQETP